MNTQPSFMLRNPLWLASLLVLTPAFAHAADADIRLNTIGYLPARSKVASVVGDAGTTFTLKRVSDNAPVFTGNLSSSITDTDTNQSIRYADFSSVVEPGSYYLEIPDVGRSVAFPIGSDVFAKQLVTAMLGYYGWRSGVAVEFTYNGDTFRQGPGHTQDGLLDYLGQPGVSRDGSRGWYDAGDYGKYTVNAGFTLGMMLQAWEANKPRLETLVLPIPEKGGALPDYLDEIKWEYDWLFTMQYSSSDARVSHKLTSLGFAAFIMPEADTTPTYYSPFGSAATADFVAAMALGARVYRLYDEALADKMQLAANASYEWLKANTAAVAPDISAFSTGGYTTADTDDRLWAAAEMWETTGDAAALADFETRAGTADSGGAFVDVEFDWSNLRNLGIYTYLRSTRDGKSAALVDKLRSALISAADKLVANRNKNGYGRAPTHYTWGGNGTVARTCMTLKVANELSPNPAYLDTCADQIAHLYGRNYYNRSFVTGAGKDPPLFPHHRPSASDKVTAPFPGLLVGGANPAATSWVDDQNDYRNNEVAINWNGALVYALAGFLPDPTEATESDAGANAGNEADAGNSPANVSNTYVAAGGGCGCRVNRERGSSGLPWALLGAAVTLGRARRRRA